MLNKNEQLLQELKEEKLIVLPYKQSKSQGNELKLALTGWKKFCKFKYHFIVIGEFNEELKNEFLISQIYGEEYDGFIYTTDDQYPIKQFNLEDVMKTYYHQFTFIGDKNAPKSYWNYDKYKTRQLLDKENLPHINYTTHYPCYFEFKKFKEIQNKYNLLNESYVFDDIYFNYFEHEQPILDSTIRLGIWNKKIFDNDFKKALDRPNIKFCVNSVEGWCKELEDSLWELYQKEES